MIPYLPMHVENEATYRAPVIVNFQTPTDICKLPSLVDGPCPVCGWTRGRRDVVHHRVTSTVRHSLAGWCVQCGQTEVLWDGR